VLIVQSVHWVEWNAVVDAAKNQRPLLIRTPSEVRSVCSVMSFAG
jgi:hypothetical protein